MNQSTLLPDPLKSLRVLLVDDDEFVLEFVGDMLHGLGIEHVRPAMDGNEALAKLHDGDEPPQLLICDLNMPGMDGIEFLRHLAEGGFEGAVIVCSGVDRRVVKTVENLVQVHKLRYLGTLIKPVEEGALVAALSKLNGVVPRGSRDLGVQMLWPDEIREGLEAGYVEVFFQPKIAVDDCSVRGAEALVRWRDPVRGLLPPVGFVSVAEKHGLIDDLTMAVFRKAVAHLADWRRQGCTLNISVNISMDNLNQLNLPESFASIVQEAGVDPGQIMLEMTESRLMTDIAKSLEIITRLRLKGFGLSIDDFGTGYSSMEKLKQLPFTEIKIDRAFVCGAWKDDAARAIVESSVKLGRALHMNIVAEGVEFQEDWDLIAESGTDEVQGYFVAKPMPAIEFIPWKAKWELQRAGELHHRAVRPQQRSFAVPGLL
ncbi:MAG TPA: EAL domain-containing response regulator [Burkholderiales bacterium]|nr:EAL domain-containing response regulator [Burkholderiales bacterium]